MLKLRSSLVTLLTYVGLAAAGFAADAAPDAAAQALAAFVAKDWPTAAEAYGRLAAQRPEDALTRLRLGVARLYLGQGEEGMAELRRAESLGAPPAPLHFRKACGEAVLGHRDAAFAELQQAIAAGFGNAQQLDTEPLLATLHDDARFRPLYEGLDRQQHPCRYDPKYRQFDYWIGEWDVVPNGSAPGTPPAENIVTLEHGDCIVHEHWKGGSTGESFNLYDASRQAWFQTWVDSTGGMHEYRGGLDDSGNMAFTAELAPNPGQAADEHGRVPTRLTFFRLGPDQVRQLSEQSTDGGKTWQTAYDLIYTRRAAKEPQKAP